MAAPKAQRTAPKDDDVLEAVRRIKYDTLLGAYPMVAANVLEEVVKLMRLYGASEKLTRMALLT